MTSPMVLDEDGVRELVRAATAGAQNAWGRKHGVHPVSLSLFLSGARGPSPALVKALGLRKVVRYEETDCNSRNGSA